MPTYIVQLFQLGSLAGCHGTKHFFIHRKAYTVHFSSRELSWTEMSWNQKWINYLHAWENNLNMKECFHRAARFRIHLFGRFTYLDPDMWSSCLVHYMSVHFNERKIFQFKYIFDVLSNLLVYFQLTDTLFRSMDNHIIKICM